VGVVHRLHQQSKRSLQLLDYSLCQIREANGRVQVVDVFCEFGDAFCVGLSLKPEAFGGQ
jgi:hypothetical protein